LIIVGLLIFYQIRYKETPVPENGFISLPTQNQNLVGQEPILYPIPKKVEWSKGEFIISKTLAFKASKEDSPRIIALIQNRLGLSASDKGSVNLVFAKVTQLGTQAYHLSVKPNTIKIEYGDSSGLFYALTTLKQLAIQSSNRIPCVYIEDNPDLLIRGALLDISRGKVPQLKTAFKMVDYLSDLKYNHLEFYLEGFSFAYPSFKNLWAKTETPFTPEEFKALDKYCRDRFIELVPNQNSLGHMNAWLATSDFKDLAECPDGYKFLGLIDMKSTLAPKNPKSLDLVKKMSEDLLPNFSSEKFNVDLDEPFELGKNKNHPINDPKQITQIYLDYAAQLNTYVELKGKKMWMWGDVISRNPEFASKIPRDITLLEWRYEDFQDFAKICKKYQESKLHYLVCPGTSSWSSYTGRTDNMLKNVENSVHSAIQYGALGMLITDWGDTPHLQYLTVSYPGLSYGGALSWNASAQTKDLLGAYLSRIAFQDSSQKMGDLVLNLGRYSRYEEFPMVSGTMTSFAYRFGMMDKMMTEAIFKKFQQGIFDLIPAEGNSREELMERFRNPKIYNYKAIIHLADSMDLALSQTHLKGPESTLILDEYRNAIRMIKLGAELKEYNNYHLQRSVPENQKLLTDMKLICSTLLAEHKELWMSRNKPGGYDTSTDSFIKLQAQIDESLSLLDKNGWIRLLNQTKDKLITAAAVLFLS
jgi:hypothetical protein